jgi:hypothetical protein
MEASHHHDPVLLNLKKYSVRKEPHSRTATAPVDDRKLQWMFRDCLNRGLDRQRKTIPKLRANVVIPRPRFQQILIRFWCPDDRECHGFLNRPALTCCHGMTSEALCSCRVIR